LAVSHPLLPHIVSSEYIPCIPAIQSPASRCQQRPHGAGMLHHRAGMLNVSSVSSARSGLPGKRSPWISTMTDVPEDTSRCPPPFVPCVIPAVLLHNALLPVRSQGPGFINNSHIPACFGQMSLMCTIIAGLSAVFSRKCPYYSRRVWEGI